MAATHVKSVKSSTSSSVPVDTASTSFTVGNLLIAGVGIAGADVPNVTVTDTTNSRSFTKVDAVSSTLGIGMAFFYLENATGGATVVRAAGLTAGQGGTLIVQEWSGFATSATFDKEVPNNTGSATTSHATGTTAATTQASELALVFGSRNGSVLVSLPSAWTNSYANINDSSADSELDGVNFWYLIAGRKDLSSTGTQQTTYTWDNSGFANTLATFKLSAAASDIPTPLHGSFQSPLYRM